MTGSHGSRWDGVGLDLSTDPHELVLKDGITGGALRTRFELLEIAIGATTIGLHDNDPIVGGSMNMKRETKLDAIARPNARTSQGQLCGILLDWEIFHP
jgi:hypothetical protein